MAGTNQLDKYEDEKDTLPRSEAMTAGTISTGSRTDQIIGDGTSFGADFQIGDWIYFPSLSAADSLRKIKSIPSDTELRIDRELSGAAAPGTAALKVPNPRNRVCSWSVVAGSALIDGVSVALGTGDTDDKSAGPMMVELPNPILIDATGVGNTVLVSKLK